MVQAAAAQADGMVIDQVSQDAVKYDYDVFVIGGGSGGVACANAAATNGLRVALADFVQPTPIGTKWGLGGTCVNVGCIPKKMMHYAATLAEARRDMKLQGWPVNEQDTPDWGTMVGSIQKHIKQLNWGFRSDLIKNKCKYFNMFATFIDAHTIKLTKADGSEQTVTTDKVVVATGGRPSYPGIPGDKEFGITSDDIFSMKKAPGKTLVVGASYVALECAGFLTALGFDTTVMVRSILLRGFDQDMANLIGTHMELYHTKFIRGATPSKLEKPDPEGKIIVTYKDAEGEKTEEYDTVLFAIGRYALTNSLNLEAAGLQVESNGKFRVNQHEQTNVPNIYAVGDVLHGKMELTPTAIKTGRLLAARLAGKSAEVMDYESIPTTVFTPLEYGTVGLTEVEAKERFGADNVATYHTKFQPLEWQYDKTVAEGKRTAYVKVLVNKTDNDRVVGFHICAPNAGEITQGVGIGFKCGMTKQQMDSVVGIHPTVAEDCLGLHLTKEENPDATKTAC